jgi:hypothetical protein
VEASQMILSLSIVLTDHVCSRHLERDIAMQLRVVRTIDVAHATRADPFMNRVGADAAATERGCVGEDRRRAARRHWLVEEPGRRCAADEQRFHFVPLLLVASVAAARNDARALSFSNRAA